MIRNQLYPYIEQYINDYLYGFNKEQMELALTEGKLELNKMVIRSDKINSIMDQSNVAFWIKAGLIDKIYVGISLMNLIGEIPLEVTIDSINIILSPSYKWINEYINKASQDFKKKNPIGINLDNKEDLEFDFDVSIFKKEEVEEIFKDKTETLISGIINSIIKGLYDVYKFPNFAVLLTINNINMRIEDDELFNYEGNFSLSINIQKIIMKLGFKGNTKKNSLKIENFSVIWEPSPSLVITNEILNEAMKKMKKDEKIDDSYYEKVKELDFTIIKDNSINENKKYIIDNFNMTINFGTKNTDESTKDIFKVQEEYKKCYFQISSNELIINIFPEFMHFISHFSAFNSKFSVIEKIKNYRPSKRPLDETLNEEKDKKNCVKNWLHYFVWAHKIQNKKNGLSENPLRAEFNRFYNIHHKNIDPVKLLKILEEKKKNQNIDGKNISPGNDINTQEDNNQAQNAEKKDEILTLDEYAFINDLDKFSRETKNRYENYKNKIKSKIIKEKYLNFSSIIEILIKGIIINMHPSINRNVDLQNSIIINLSGVGLKINVSTEQFNFNLNLSSLDIGPSDRIYAERVILCPTSYRENLLNKDNNGINPNNNLIITPGLDSDINSANDVEKREAGFTGLLKKYNPKYEDKIKIIDETLSNIHNSSNFNNSMINLYNSPSKTNKGTRNKILNSNTYFKSNNKLFKSYESLNDLNLFNNPDNKSRNSSFAKNIINTFTETDINLKNKLKKQKNELKISQAVNNYNSNSRQKSIYNSRYKNLDNNLEKSNASINLKFTNKFIFTSKTYFYKSNNLNQVNNKKKTPHNLLEIYSNSKIGALKLKYIKYNNSFSLDDFSIQLGTIRINSFYQYFIDMITIFKDYQKSNNRPQIKKSNIHSTDGGGMKGNQVLLTMRNDFIDILSKGINQSESINEYIDYLDKENKKLFNFNNDKDSKQMFELNYLFSFFPKGIKFYFDYENIEGVYYDKMEKMMGKFMISPFNINISIGSPKIIVNLFGFHFEINNLIESSLLIEKLIDQCKKMFEDKKDMIEIIIEPCFTLLKNELENDSNLDESVVNNINEYKKNFSKI